MAKGLGRWYVEIEKQAFWRGAVHTWVNRYVMSGGDPSVSDATTVITGLKNIENFVYPAKSAGAGVGFVEGRAYASTGGAPIVTVPYNVNLAVATATGFGGPSTPYTSLSWTNQLEACLDIRTPLTGLSSSGKPVYLRKYFRGFAHTTGEDQSTVPIAAADLTEIASATANWKNGIGGTSYVLVGLKGQLASAAPTAQPYLGNHQVPRGRKKKTNALVGATAFGQGVVIGAAAGQQLNKVPSTLDVPPDILAP